MQINALSRRKDKAWTCLAPVNQTLRVMQLTAFFLFALAIGVSAKTSSQTITLKAKDAKLEQLFSEVKSQTGFVFVYDIEAVEQASRVSIQANNLPLKEFLKEVLKDKPFEYSIRNRTIFIREKRFAAKVSPQLELDVPPIPVRGRIVNEKGEPITGASVMVKGSNKGTTSDADGNFVLNNVDENATLVITAVSIEATEIKINSRFDLGMVNVKAKISEAEAVIVNSGYYKISKDRATMNISKVTAEAIEKQPVTSPLMALQGRVPGLDITPINGAPGSRINIQIRGLNSLRSTANYPLYVIDGVPVDSRPISSSNTAFYNGGIDPLSTINPSSIASIEVLKDAGATAIYGSRGANGVILITTKSPQKNGRTSLDVNMYTGWGRLPKKVDLLNTQQYLAMRKEALTNDNALSELEAPFAPLNFPDLAAWDTTRYTDWQEELLGQTSRISDAQISFSGGNANTSFRIGGEYYKETTITLGDFGFKRYNGSLNLNHTSSNKRFNAQSTITYGSTNNKLGSESFLVSNALSLPPNAPSLYNDDGSLNWGFATLNAAGNNITATTWNNPLSILKRSHYATSTNLIANGTIVYEIVHGVVLKASLGYTDLKNDEIIKNPVSSYDPTIPNPTANVTFGYHGRKSWIVEPQMVLAKRMSDHSIDMIAGATFQGGRFSYLTLRGNGYTSDVFLNSVLGAPTRTIVADHYEEYRYMAFFSRFGYAWKNKYLLDISGRRDGSSRFGPGKRFGSFGAASAAWIFSKEGFIRNNIRWLSFGKVRGSYGTTGNDQITDYQFLDTYGFTSTTYQNTVSLVPFGLSNPELAWEKTKKFEIGLELRFVQDRIAAEASRYINRSSNQLISYPLPVTTGFAEFPTNFKDATIENAGWEFVLSGQPISMRHLSWNIAINLAVPRNKLVKYDGIEQSPYATTYKVGEPLTIQRQYVWGGIDPQTGLHVIKDMDGNGAINNNDRTFTKWYGRRYYGGISNSFTYMNFDLSFLFQFSDFTGSGLWTTLPSDLPGVKFNQPSSVLNRWQKPGDITATPRFSQSITNLIFYSDVSGSDLRNNTIQFMRLKTLSVSYQLPVKLIKRIKAQESRIYLQGQNLFVSKDVSGFDPETGVSLPPLKMFTAGIQVKF